MLKGIPSIISPELLHILMEMGHGDELVIGDGNFPAAACAQRLVRADGHDVPTLLNAILTLFPLDTFVEAPACLMAVVPGDDRVPEIWSTYQQIIDQHQPGIKIAKIERFKFYDRAKEAYAILATGEAALYANIIIKKGVVI